MCNIAGYSGKRNAAPILIEMLRRQQSFDGGLSVGVATIHEGKLHYRKVVGDVDTLLRETVYKRLKQKKEAEAPQTEVEDESQEEKEAEKTE